jgi:hypothetical protein
MAFNDDRESIAPRFGESEFSIVSTDETTVDALDSFLDGDETPKPKTKENPTVPAKKNVKASPKKTEPEEEEETEDADQVLDDFLNDEENTGKPKKKAQPEETTDDEDDSTEDNSSEDDENQFNYLAKELFKAGIFTFNEGEDEESLKIESAEEFRDRFDLEKKKGASEALESFLARFGEPYADMFESVFIKGVDPIEYLQTYAQIDNLENIDLTQEHIQERIVREKLTKDGYDPEDIEKEVDRLKNYNDLESRAKADHKVLLKKAQQEKIQKENEKALERQREAQKKNQYISTVRQILGEKLQKKDFDGIPVDRAFAEEVNSYLTKERFKLPSGKLITEFEKEMLELDSPQNFQMKVKVAMLLKMLKKDPTLSKIKKRAITNETSEIFSKLKKREQRQETTKKVNTENGITEGKWF